MGPNHNTQDPKLSIAFGLSLRADWGCCPRNRSISIYRVEELAHSRAAVTHLPAAPGWEHCNSWCHLEVSEESSKNHYLRPLLPLKTYTPAKGSGHLRIRWLAAIALEVRDGNVIKAAAAQGVGRCPSYL